MGRFTVIIGFMSIFANCALMGYGSSLKCCFEVLRNHSVSYQLSGLHEPNCKETWSKNDYVLVDEHENVDEKKVEYMEPQKLILKPMDEKADQVTYRRDCLHTGRADIAHCEDHCASLEESRTTPATETNQETGRDHKMIIVGSIIVVVIIVVVIIGISRHRNKCNTFRFWNEAPKTETQTVV